MLLTPNTYSKQVQLAAYCKTGDEKILGQVDKKHVTHYRRLVFNNVKDALSAAYPLTKMLLGDEKWLQLIEEFFANHSCRSNKIWQMPQELKEYLYSVNHAIFIDYPYIWDLIRFEWLEIAVYMSEDTEVDFVSGDITRDNIIINPELTIERFEYPVHLKKAVDITSEDKGIYFLSVHRHPETGKVLFTNLSPVYIRLIELLFQKPQTLSSLAYKISEEFNQNNTAKVKKLLLRFMKSACRTKLVLGTELAKSH